MYISIHINCISHHVLTTQSQNFCRYPCKLLLLHYLSLWKFYTYDRLCKLILFHSKCYLPALHSGYLYLPFIHKFSLQLYLNFKITYYIKVLIWLFCKNFNAFPYVSFPLFVSLVISNLILKFVLLSIDFSIICNTPITYIS